MQKALLQDLNRNIIESSTIYQASDFFVPTPDFLKYLQDFTDGKVIVDLGCGNGLFGREHLLVNGGNYLGIDFMVAPVQASEKGLGIFSILRQDAISFKFGPNDIPFICRPCGGDWVEHTIQNAFDQVGFIVYVGLEKNYARDIDHHHYVRLYHFAGKEGEEAFLLLKEPLGDRKPLIILQRDERPTLPQNRGGEESDDEEFSDNPLHYSSVTGGKLVDIPLPHIRKFPSPKLKRRIKITSVHFPGFTHQHVTMTEEDNPILSVDFRGRKSWVKCFDDREGEGRTIHRHCNDFFEAARFIRHIKHFVFPGDGYYFDTDFDAQISVNFLMRRDGD